MGPLFFAEGVEDGGGADGEADYGAQGGDEHGVGGPVEDVGGEGGEGEGYAYHVEPEGGADGGAWDAVSAEAELEEEGGEADGGYDDQGEGTVEGAVAGVDDDQGEGEEEQGRGEDGPAAWWGRRGRLGSGVWQGVPLQWLYSVGGAFSNGSAGGQAYRLAGEGCLWVFTSA